MVNKSFGGLPKLQIDSNLFLKILYFFIVFFYVKLFQF
jgi:hypothetical protein